MPDNPFDQFDEPKSSTNPFDQFDVEDKKSNTFDQFDESKLMTGLRVAGQGIPVLGHYIGDTAETEKFKKDHPFLSTALNLGAGTVAMLPLMGPLAAGGAAVKGLSLIPSLFRTAGTLGKTFAAGGTISGLDNLSEQLNNGADGINFKDMAKAATLGGGVSALLPLGGKMISPGLRKATADRVIKSTGLAALGGVATGFNPLVMAALAGGGRILGTNTKLNNPTSQAILASLGSTLGSNVDESVVPIP